MEDELDAMRKIASAMEPLDADVRARVLQWMNSKYSGVFTAPKTHSSVTGQAAAPLTTFADFFHSASPSSEKEKAAVAAYWTQYCERVDPFGSQILNSSLKDLGYRVSNITDALSQCMKERPALIIQMKKSGTSKQARKTYKMTEAGKRWVESLVAANTGDGNG